MSQTGVRRSPPEPAVRSAGERESWSQTWTYEGPLAGPDPLLTLFLSAVAETLQNYFSGAAVEATLRSVGYRMVSLLEREGLKAHGGWQDTLIAMVDFVASRGVARELVLEVGRSDFELVARGVAGSLPVVGGDRSAEISPLGALVLAVVSRAGGTVERFSSEVTKEGVLVLRGRVGEQGVS